MSSGARSEDGRVEYSQSGGSHSLLAQPSWLCGCKNKMFVSILAGLLAGWLNALYCFQVYQDFALVIGTTLSFISKLCPAVLCC